MRLAAIPSSTCRLRPAITALAAVLAAFLWLAAQPAAAAGLKLDLSKIEERTGGCTATLLIGNGLGQTLDRFNLDLVLFDDKGAPFDRLLIDLAPLPADRTTKAKFPLHGGPCAGISRIQVHAVPACKGHDGKAYDCLDGLIVGTRTAIGFGK